MIKHNTLGRSNISVTELCFGSLTVGPDQANLPIEEGAAVIAHGFERGIDFIDTAQYYENYDYIRRAMELSGKYDVVISSKTYAYNAEDAIQAVEQARKCLNRDYIDIFMLHEQMSYDTLRGHMPALEALFELRERGVIRAVGASMHHIAAVDGVCRMSALYPLDIIHPIFNMKGVGIADASSPETAVDEMSSAIRRAKDCGIGIFTMKPLGGGHLIASAENALNFVRSSGLPDSIALGMQSIDEVDANIEFFETGRFSEKSTEKLKSKKRHLHIEDYCEACGSCIKRCGQSALRIENGRAAVNPDKCVLCGYCAKVCPQFAIKVL